MQRKLGEADADGNWQFGSPASASAMDDKTQAVAGHKRRARTAPAAQFSASNLQAAVHHNAAKEKKKTVGSKPVGQGEQPVSNAEEQPAAAKPNENPATPVQHVPLASIRRGRGQLPDSSDEDEEVVGARTPPPRAPAPPSGSDEDSDEEDDESDSGSSPSDD